MVDLLLLREPVGKALVVGPLESIPIGSRDAVPGRQLRVIFGKQRGRFVAGWEEHPSVKIVVIGEIQEEFNLCFVATIRPKYGPASVARETCQPDVWSRHHPNGNTTPAQAPRD